MSEQLPDDEAFDAYSQAVMRVAERLSPSVASVRARRGGGSAVAITPDGFLLTSAHVVQRARRVRASFTDGRELMAEIVGADPLSDLAVLRTTDDALRAATLGDAEKLRVGQLVVAIGNPHGFSGSSPPASSRRSGAHCRRARAQRRAGSTTSSRRMRL